MSFRENSPKSRQNGQKFVKKDVKKSNNSQFLSDRFQLFLLVSDYWKSNVASPIVEVR